MGAAIQFDEAQHRYTLNGVVVPSVTQILEPLNDLSGIPRKVLDAKAALGNAVHKACELYNLGTLDESTVHPRVMPYLEQYRLFLERSGFRVILTEQRVFSLRYRYAGTLDLFGELNGRKILADIKTACQVTPVYGPQTAAYAGALEECEGHKTEERFVLRLAPDLYRLEPMNDPTDLSTFYAALQLHAWRKKYAA